MAVKAVIFDMDGVLIDSMKYHIEGWKLACDKEKIKITREQIAVNEGLDFNLTLKKETGLSIPDEQLDRINEGKEEYLRKYYRPMPYKGIVDFIHLLRQKKIKTAIVTASPREFTTRVVSSHFPQCFDAMVTGSDVTRRKPAPDAYLKAVEFLKIKKDECIVIENSPVGIQAAKAAGLKVYALETTLHKKYLAEADRVFKNHDELFDSLKRIILN